MEEAKTQLTQNNLSDDLKDTLTIRFIMEGEEVESIIDEKGEIIERFQEESGANINISDESCPERIVTVSGSISAIYKAFGLITKKFVESCSQLQDNTNEQDETELSIRLIVPHSQCGSLIGKKGSKIKTIRETSGCSIQIASKMLPNSTERTVTVSGSVIAVPECIYHLCRVMLDSPPKGNTKRYTGGLNPFLAALAGSQLRTNNNHSETQVQSESHELIVPNDLIGCIIGKGGTNIAEIRQTSGAMISISNVKQTSGNTDRTITITGNPDSVALAQHLINTRISMESVESPIRT